MIKGGGGALTREKIVAAVARKFVCICDDSKQVDVLGKFPLPVEVIPMARGHVGRATAPARRPARRCARDSRPTTATSSSTCHGLTITDPPGLESELNQVTGVVTNGLFARRGADVLLLAEPGGVRTMTARGERNMPVICSLIR